MTESDDDPDEPGSDDDDSKDNNKLDIDKVNVFKSNLARFMPAKLGCHKLLNDEEKLFLKGLEHYAKRINLGNFIKA